MIWVQWYVSFNLQIQLEKVISSSLLTIIIQENKSTSPISGGMYLLLGSAVDDKDGWTYILGAYQGTNFYVTYIQRAESLHANAWAHGYCN